MQASAISGEFQWQIPSPDDNQADNNSPKRDDITLLLEEVCVVLVLMCGAFYIDARCERRSASLGPRTLVGTQTLESTRTLVGPRTRSVSPVLHDVEFTIRSQSVATGFLREETTHSAPLLPIPQHFVCHPPARSTVTILDLVEGLTSGVHLVMFEM